MWEEWAIMEAGLVFRPYHCHHPPESWNSLLGDISTPYSTHHTHFFSFAELVISSSPLVLLISLYSLQWCGPVAREDEGRCTSKMMQEGTSILCCVVYNLWWSFSHFLTQVQERRRKSKWAQSKGLSASFSHELELGQDQKGWLEWPGGHLGNDDDIVLFF